MEQISKSSKILIRVASIILFIIGIFVLSNNLEHITSGNLGMEIIFLQLLFIFPILCFLSTIFKDKILRISSLIIGSLGVFANTFFVFAGITTSFFDRLGDDLFLLLGIIMIIAVILLIIGIILYNYNKSKTKSSKKSKKIKKPKAPALFIVGLVIFFIINLFVVFFDNIPGISSFFFIIFFIISLLYFIFVYSFSFKHLLHIIDLIVNVLYIGIILFIIVQEGFLEDVLQVVPVLGILFLFVLLLPQILFIIYNLINIFKK